MAPRKSFARAAMLARVERALAPDLRLAPTAVLGGVIQLLVGHVSAGEIQDIVATLPRPIAALWHDLARPAPAAARCL